MAKIKRGILGGFSGSIGNVVGSSWKGIAVVKAKPLSVANPQTVSQTSNRSQFKAVTQAASKMLTNIVKPLWDASAQLMSGYNAFVSNNKSAYSASGVLDVSKLIITQGKQKAQTIESLSHSAGSKTVTIAWDESSIPSGSSSTDKAYAVAFNANTNEYASSSDVSVRDDGSVDVAFETALTSGDVVSAWLCFTSANGKIQYAAGSDLSNTVQ